MNEETLSQKIVRNLQKDLDANAREDENIATRVYTRGGQSRLAANAGRVAPRHAAKVNKMRDRKARRDLRKARHANDA